MDSIGAFEAKTHFPRLLDRVAQGESVAITRHGRPVATLVPAAHDGERVREAMDRIRRRRARLGRVDLEELIDTTHDGHRYK